MDQTFSASGVGSLLSVGSVSSSSAAVTETPPVGAFQAAGVGILSSFDQSMLQAQQQRSGTQGQQQSGQSLPGGGGLLPAGLSEPKVAGVETASTQVVVDAVADVAAKSADMTEQRLAQKQREGAAEKASLRTELVPSSAISVDLNADLKAGLNVDLNARQSVSVNSSGDETLKQIDQYRRADLAVAVDSALKRLTSITDKEAHHPSSRSVISSVAQGALAEEAPLSAHPAHSVAAVATAPVASTGPLAEPSTATAAVSQVSLSAVNSAPVSASDTLDRSAQMPLSSTHSAVRESLPSEVGVNGAPLARNTSVDYQPQPSLPRGQRENSDPARSVVQGLGENPSASIEMGDDVDRELLDSEIAGREAGAGTAQTVEPATQPAAANGAATPSFVTSTTLVANSIPGAESEPVIEPAVKIPLTSGQAALHETSIPLSLTERANAQSVTQEGDRTQPPTLVASVIEGRQTPESKATVLPADHFTEPRQSANMTTSPEPDTRVAAVRTTPKAVAPAALDANVVSSGDGVIEAVAQVPVVSGQTLLRESLARLQSADQPSPSSVQQRGGTPLQSNVGAIISEHQVPEQNVTGRVLPMVDIPETQQSGRSAAEISTLAASTDSFVSHFSAQEPSAQGASQPVADIRSASGSDDLTGRPTESAVQVSVVNGSTPLSESLARLQSSELTSAPPVRQTNDVTQASIVVQQPINSQTGNVVGQATAQPVAQNVDQAMVQSGGAQGHDNLVSRAVPDKSSGIDVGRSVESRQEARQEASLTSFADSLASASKPTRAVQEPLQANMPQGVKPGMPSWGPAVNDRVMLMASKNGQFAEIQLDPPELGSLQVKLHLKNDQVSVVFNTPHNSVREALEQNMPRLREQFAEQGLSLSESSVEDQSGGQQRERPEPEAAFAGYRQDNRDEGQAESAVSEHVSLVDYYA